MKNFVRLSKNEMKMVMGGVEEIGEIGGEGGGKVCKYRCCTDQHTNCSNDTVTAVSCSSYTDCANPGNVSCSGGGHLFWRCE